MVGLYHYKTQFVAGRVSGFFYHMRWRTTTSGDGQRHATVPCHGKKWFFSVPELPSCLCSIYWQTGVARDDIFPTKSGAKEPHNPQNTGRFAVSLFLVWQYKFGRPWCATLAGARRWCRIPLCKHNFSRWCKCNNKWSRTILRRVPTMCAIFFPTEKSK